MAEKLLLQALKGQKTSRVPFWFMRQAGRYLPEYRELRAKKGGFLDMVYDPVSACEITLQPIRRFGMDGAILFSDILVIPHALGQKVEFVAGEGPKLEILESFAKLDPEKIHETLAPIYQTVRNIRKSLTAEAFDHTALIGFAGSPWTVACYMIEGGGSKDFGKAKAFAYARPDEFAALLDILCKATTAYLSEQIKAGAEAVQLFDSWAGMTDSRGFEDWVIAPTKRIVRDLRALHPDVPIIGFPKGAGALLAKYTQETGINGIGLDSSVIPGWKSGSVTPQGNLDPFALLAGGGALEERARAILEGFSDAPFIFNLGHGIDKSTPVSHVESLVRIIQEY